MGSTVRSPVSKAASDLRNWLAWLAEDFDEGIPDPLKVESVLGSVEEEVGVRLTRAIGSCTNGIAFLTASNTVVKFTIDKQEALLWGRLWTNGIPCIADCYGSWQLVSREQGELIVYVVHVEYVPHPLGNRLVSLLHDAASEYARYVDNILRTGRPVTNSETSAIYTNVLRTFANKDRRLNDVVTAMTGLANSGVYVYDLQPDNFKIAKDGTMKMIDPSTPVGVRGRVDEIVYESLERFVGHLWLRD